MWCLNAGGKAWGFSENIRLGRKYLLQNIYVNFIISKTSYIEYLKICTITINLQPLFIT